MKIQSYQDLSFISNHQWVPERTGKHGVDCQRGATYAEEMLALMANTDSPLILGAVVRAIVTAQTWEGVEIGFFDRLNTRMMALEPLPVKAAMPQHAVGVHGHS
jgi:hypothetical protein